MRDGHLRAALREAVAELPDNRLTLAADGSGRTNDMRPRLGRLNDGQQRFAETGD